MVNSIASLHGPRHWRGRYCRDSVHCLVSGPPTLSSAHSSRRRRKKLVIQFTCVSEFIDSSLFGCPIFPSFRSCLATCCTRMQWTSQIKVNTFFFEVVLPLFLSLLWHKLLNWAQSKTLFFSLEFRMSVLESWLHEVCEFVRNWVGLIRLFSGARSSNCRCLVGLTVWHTLLGWCKMVENSTGLHLDSLALTRAYSPLSIHLAS